MVPTIVAMTAALNNAVSYSHHLAQQRLTDMAESFANALDVEIGQRAASLRALAASPLLDDFPSEEALRNFYQQARNLGRAHDARIGYCAKVGSVWTPMIHTEMSEMPPLKKMMSLFYTPDWEARLVRDGLIVSNLMRSPHDGRWVALVHVPVIRNATLVGVIAMTLDADRTGLAMREHKMTDRMFATMVDSSGIMISRMPTIANRVGHPIKPDLKDAMDRRPSGYWTGMSLSGFEATFAFTTPRLAQDWRIAVAQPVADINQIARSSHQTVIWLLIIVLSAIMLLVGVVAKRLSTAISTVATRAADINRGKPFVMPPASLVREIDSLSASLAETSARLLADNERRQLIAREVEHRSKNLLTVVLAMVKLTKAESITDLRRSLETRILSMSKTHSLLAKHGWEGAKLSEIITSETAAHRDGFVVEGYDVCISGNAVQPLAIIIHELTTNATKYGALSTPEGRVYVNWHIEGPRLILTWRETGVPLATPPARRGFGSSVIRSSAHQIGGEASMTWSSTGLVCSMTFATNKLTVGSGKDA